jgi:hypothetical protein
LQSHAIWALSTHQFTGIVAHEKKEKEIHFLCLVQKMKKENKSYSTNQTNKKKKKKHQMGFLEEEGRREKNKK